VLNGLVVISSQNQMFYIGLLADFREFQVGVFHAKCLLKAIYDDLNPTEKIFERFERFSC
jgi:hypothetical protein